MKTIDLNNKNVVISRTDSIGDVLLTLPICSWIKHNFPDCRVLFLGKGYTKPIIEAHNDVDQFIDWAEFENMPRADKKTKFRELKADVIIHIFPNKEIAALAKAVRIPVRVGTSHRMYHLLTCTHRIDFTRKRSELHEAQLNHALLKPFGLKKLPSADELNKTTYNLIVPEVKLPEEFSRWNDKKTVLLHPKSQGSAVEWPIQKYMKLAKKLADKDFRVIFTGTDKEGKMFRQDIPEHNSILDSTGKLDLRQLMRLISESDTLVACSTGPFHLAGYYGINAIGLFSPRRPIHPGRWRALGPNVKTIVADEGCSECKKGKKCDCLKNVQVEQVFEEII